MKTLFALLALTASACAGVFVKGPPTKPAGTGLYWQGTAVGNLSTSFPEPSGMARPHVAANVGHMWMEQDSGGPNTFLAVRLSDASTQGSWTLGTLATQIDWEDCASARIGGVNYLFMADTGNNSGTAVGSRGTGIDVHIYRCIEPTITGSNGTILDADIYTIDCVYPGVNGPAGSIGSRDCECLLVDPENGTLYFVLKRLYNAAQPGGAGPASTPFINIYSLPFALTYSGTQTLTYEGTLCSDTSTTSLLIATGSKSFTTAGTIAYPVGMRLRASDGTTTSNFMEGDVTSRSGTSLTINCDVIGGSGTLANWKISPAPGGTPTNNNGVVTGGTVSEDGSQIVLCNYGNPYPGATGQGGTGLMLFQRNKGSQTIGQALTQNAPRLLTSDTGGGVNYPHSNPPSYPQREAVEFSNGGSVLYSIGEYYSTYGTTTNPLVKYDVTNRPVTTLALQNGLNGYTACVDTMITSAAAGAGTDNSATASLVSDIDYNTTLTNTISSVASASGGTQITVTCNAVTSISANKYVGIIGASNSAYNGTWYCTAVSSPTCTLNCAYAGNATSGTIVGHNLSNEDRQGLVKFTDLSAIPSGATIVGAKLVLYVNTEGKSLQLNRIVASWSGTSTYTSLTNGLAFDNADAVITPDAQLISTAMDGWVGFVTINIPVATVQGWVNGSFANQGWLVTQCEETTGDGFQFDSSEGATQARKPMLIIRYLTP